MNEQYNVNTNQDNSKQKRHDFERNFAIIIGINEYDEKNKPLKLAVPDAELMKDILSSPERKEDEIYKILLLTDQDATQDKINKLLDNLKNGKIVFPEETVDLKENHRILFYFSGHGYASIRETNQLDENEQFLLCQDGEKLPMQTLTNTLGQLPCRHKLLILDCCYSGAIRRTSTAEIPGYRTASLDDDGMSFRADYDRMWKNPTFTVITSAGYELALDSDNKEQKNSYFAMALCNAIKCSPNAMDEGKNKADSNKDGIITAQELCTYIQSSPQVSSRQLPQIYSLTSSEQTPGAQYIFLLPEFNPNDLKPIDKENLKPYKGLLSYNEKDYPVFCGRKRFITQLLDKVCTNNQKLTVVIGASGSGKSSLVKAGLIPKLKSKWLSCEFRPGNSPFKTFCDTLIECLGIKNKNDSITTKIESFEQQLQGEYLKYKRDAKFKKILKNRKINKGFQKVYQEFINLLSRAEDQNVLIAIDQFEELITLCQIPEKEFFLKLLNDILTGCKNVRLVVTVRSDFETYFQQSLKESEASNPNNAFNITHAWNNEGVRLYVGEMNSHELKQVIERPAALFSIDFESEKFVAHIIEQVVGRPGALPLLSFVLEQLYQKVKSKSDKKITQDDYDDLGGVIGALKKTADQEYEKLTKLEDGEDESVGKLRQQMIKLLMLRMVSLKGGQATKRPVSDSELKYPKWKSRHKNATEEIEKIRKQLEQSRLIVTEAGYTELAHDALIEHWDKLQEWIQEEKENLILHNRLMVAVEDWQKWDKQKNFIILFLSNVQYPIDWFTEQNMRFAFWLGQSANYTLRQLNPLRLVNYLITKITAQKSNTQVNTPRNLGGHLWHLDPRLGLLRQLLYKKNSWLNANETEFVRQSVIKQAQLITVLGYTLLGVSVLILTLWYQAKTETEKAKLESAQALRESTEANLASNRQLEAGLDILKAQKTLDSIKVNLVEIPPKVRSSIESTLFKMLYGTQERNRLQLNSGTLYEVVFNPNPNKDQLATVGDGEIVRLWNSKGEPLAPLITGQEDVYSVAFRYDPENSNSDSTLFATGGADGTIKFWEIQNDGSSISCEPTSKPSCSIKSIELSDSANTTKIIDDIEFSADGKFLALVEQELYSGKSRVRLWKLVKQDQTQKENRTYTLEELKKFPSTPLGKENVWGDIAFNPKNANQLATVGEGDVVKLWDITSGNKLGERKTQQGSVYSVAFSNNGTLMTGGTDGTVKRWKINTQTNSSEKVEIVQDSHEIKTEPTKDVYSIAVSNDGNVATVGENEIVQLWKSNGDRIPNIELLEGSLSDSQTRGVVFSPDGKQIATLGSDNTVRLWDTSGKRLSRFHTDDDETYNIGFSSNPNILATVGSLKNKNNISLFNPASGQIIDSVITKRNFRSLIFIPGANSKEEQLVAIDENGAVGILKIKKDDQVAFALGKDNEPIIESIDSAESGLKLDNDKKIKDLTLSPNGSYAAIVKQDDGTVELREPNKPVPSPPNISNVNSVAISPDNQKIVTAGEDGIVRIWNFEDWLKSSNSTKPIELNTQQGSISRLTFNPINSNQLVTGGEDGTVRLWDLSRNEPTQDRLLTSGKLKTAAASPDGTRLATLSTEGVINLWDEEGDKFKVSPPSIDQLNKQRKKALKEAQTITLSSTGKYIAIIGEDGNLLLWNIEHDSLADFIQADENNKVKSVAFSPDDAQLIVIRDKGQVEVLQLSDQGIGQHNLNENTNQLSNHLLDKMQTTISEQQDIISVSFSQKNSSYQTALNTGNINLATLSEDGTVKLWDAQGKYIKKSFKTDQKNPHIIALSPDGKLLATGAAEDKGTDGTVRVWDIKGVQIQQFRVELGDVKSVTFSPDGQHLAIIAKEENSNNPEKFNSLLFDVHDDSRQPINSSNIQQGTVVNATFTSDGNLATLSSNGQLSLWYMSNEILQKKLCQLVWNYLQNNPASKQSIEELCDNVNEPLTNNFSTGERLLIQSNFNIDKLAGIEAIAAGNFEQAVKDLSTYLKEIPNDPEAQIYLNNAQIGKQTSHTIAVSVPISNDVNGSLEILRGVAQAQKEINEAGGINKVPLRILIADDNNQPDTAKQIAEELVKNPEVLGVVGHYASDVTLATGKIYQAGKLVAVSPTSTSVKLTGFSDYIFRTVPNDSVAAKALADYMQKQLNKKNAAIFYNSQSDYSESLKSEFVKFLRKQGGEVSSKLIFDLSDPNFNADQSVEQSIESGAEVLVLLPNTAELDDTLKVVKANKQRLSLLGGDDVYTPKTLKDGGADAGEMVVAVPWHILASQTNFPETSRNLWKADVNWRTAMSYDATTALIEGLKNNPTREGLAQSFRSKDFTAKGETGEVKFNQFGDRNQNIQLVKIQANSKSRSKYGYDFEPISE